MTFKELKLLGAIFVFALTAGLIFMFQSHSNENTHSDIVYIDEYQIVTESDKVEPVEETDVPAGYYADRSHMEQLVEAIGFIR